MFASAQLRISARGGWRRLTVGLLAGGVVLGAAGMVVLAHRDGAPAAASASAIVVPPPADVLVFVSGAVARPGLYRLAPGARGTDAVAAAGGILPSADSGKLPDLASKVHDGRQINVPYLRAGSSRVAKLDLNGAGVEELAAVPGMPLGLAQAIVDYRSNWGGFTSVGELVSVLGVDRPTEVALAHYLTVLAQAP